MRNGPRILLLLIAMVLLAAAAPADAREGHVVTAVKVNGLPDGFGGVTRQLGLSAPGGLLGGGRPVFRQAVLEADRNRLRLLLARGGYPFAAVDAEVRPESRGRRVQVHFTVRPGRPVRIGGHRLEGAASATSKTVARALPRGRVFTDAAASSARERLLLELARAGHALAEVNVRIERPDSFTVVPVFEVVPGAVQRFGAIEVTGLPDDLTDLAHRTLGVPPGARYSPDLLERARDNLRELRLFRRIRLATAPESPGVLGLKADLAAAASRTARLSVGSWTDDPVRLRGSWTHRNLFRRGRGFGVHGTLSPYYREVGARAWWPSLLGPRSVVEFNAAWFEEDEESYDLENRVLEAAVLLRPAGRLLVRLGAALEDVIVSGTGLDRSVFTSPDGRQLVLSCRVHDDRADDLLYPTRGTRLGLDLAWSPPGALSAAPFASAEGRIVAYAPLPGGVVWASRAALGVARPLGDAVSLLPNHRFFAGGVTTMRGYGRRRLGPVDGDDDPVGGQARLLAATELRAPVTGWLELAAFLDAGQVWSHRNDLDVAGLETALGGGLVFHTPVGPVRTDLARLTDSPRAGEPRTVFHLAIGHPF